jgi:hypothetical protein
MLSKVCASWLIVLVLLPFTAPFSTFDLADFLPGQSDGAIGIPFSGTPTASLTRAVLPRAVPFPSRMGRLRLILSRLRAPNLSAAVPAAAPTLFGSVPIHFVPPPSRPSVLRI